MSIESLTTSATSGFAGVIKVVWYIVLLGILGFAAWFFLYLKSFNIKVVVKEVTNRRKIIDKDKARIKKDKNGAYYIQYFKRKIKREVPSEKCFELDKKGKRILEVYYIPQDDSYLPITDEFDYEDYKNKNIMTVKPYTTTQRLQVMHEFREAENYKKKKLGEQLLALAPYIVIFLILLVFMIFFSKVVQPTKDMAATTATVAENLAEASKNMADVCLDRQTLINENIKANNLTSYPTTPSNVPN